MIMMMVMWCDDDDYSDKMVWHNEIDDDVNDDDGDELVT